MPNGRVARCLVWGLAAVVLLAFAVASVMAGDPAGPDGHGLIQLLL